MSVPAQGIIVGLERGRSQGDDPTRIPGVFPPMDGGPDKSLSLNASLRIIKGNIVLTNMETRQH